MEKGEQRMDFYEVIRSRRSIRSYKSDPIPEEVLNRVLEAARIAPSGSNRQPWEFIVLKDEELKRRWCLHVETRVSSLRRLW